ncbi:MAG: hypothetical protein AB7K41_09350 [Bdellovibrionales bacterium]
MKNLKLIFLVATLAMTVSCAMESNKSQTNVPTLSVPTDGSPYVPPVTGPGYNPGTQYGGSAPLTIESVPRMSQYTGRSMNNPQNIVVNLNMVKTSGGTFGGTVTITYTEAGYPYVGYFTAGNSAEATKFNRSFSYGGKTVWHGVFEDYIGGLVVVIDEIVDLGDGQGAQDTVSGSIYFKNFGLTYAPHPPTYCWFAYAGPYDCRPWPEGKSMNTYANSIPTNTGYLKLGTFTGLSIKKAFNNETL